MRVFYVVYEDHDTGEELSKFVHAPDKNTAILSLGERLEIVEVLEFSEEEAYDFLSVETTEQEEDYDGDEWFDGTEP